MYDIIEAESKAELIELINAELKQGATLSGNVCTYERSGVCNGLWYAQAIVRQET